MFFVIPRLFGPDCGPGEVSHLVVLVQIKLKSQTVQTKRVRYESPLKQALVCNYGYMNYG